MSTKVEREQRLFEESMETAIPSRKKMKLPLWKRLKKNKEADDSISLVKLAGDIEGIEADPEPPPAPRVHKRPRREFD